MGIATAEIVKKGGCFIADVSEKCLIQKSIDGGTIVNLTKVKRLNK